MTIPIYVAGLALVTLLIITLVILPRNMTTVKPVHPEHHIAFLVSNSVIMSIFLIIIMIGIAAFIQPMR